MKKIILFIFLMMDFSFVISGEIIPASHFIIKKIKIIDKLTAKLANREFDRRLFVLEKHGNRDVLSFLNKPYHTDDYLEEVSNQNGTIIAISISTYGILGNLHGRYSYHDVTSCLFIDRKTGCVISRESATACAGQWVGDGKWQMDDGETIDLFSVKKSILNWTTADTDLLDKDNYDRCEKL